MQILIIYTGGTIGMKQDPKTGALLPFDFAQIEDEVPELKKFGFKLDTVSFDPIDSSDITPDLWVKWAQVIYDNYDKYSGFVILHGTDTMAYSASALSFMFEGLNKPVIFTGSQLPIGMLRTDGKENLISAIEIAAARIDGKSAVPEVCIYFENKLMRGNRTTKFSSEHFNAFNSFNYPLLGEAGIHLRFNTQFIHYDNAENLRINTLFDTRVSVLKIFPGIKESTVRAMLDTDTRSVILETFGSGNIPTADWLTAVLSEAVERDKIILSISQCKAGSVEQGKYAGSLLLKNIGVLSGNDITFEAALTKLFDLQGKYRGNKQVIDNLLISLRGEMTN